MPRRFPPPWLITELEACFVVIDGAGQKLAYIYYEEESGRRSAAKLLTKDEARRARQRKPAPFHIQKILSEWRTLGLRGSFSRTLLGVP
jgi:hypothetical protein